MAVTVELAPEVNRTLNEAKELSVAVLKTPEELADIVVQFASSDGWMDKVRLRTDRRWYERLYHNADYDIWVISWLPGQSTGFHDHGASSGAFVVATGVLEEHRPAQPNLVVSPGKPRSFGHEYAHDVRNASAAPAISIHAYSPPLSEMNEYELNGSQLVPKESISVQAERSDRAGQGQKSTGHTGALSIEQILSTARARLERLSPREAYDAVTKADAILVDIRPEAQRAVEGTIEGALVVERNVLEWRFDPASSSRLPLVKNHDLQVIVFCSEGYTSSLAAAALQELGLYRATDLAGGFHAWQSIGLPTLQPLRVSKSFPSSLICFT